MTEEEFYRITELPGQTMIVFADQRDADLFVLRQKVKQPAMHGIICRVSDWRTGSGLVVQWRDPVPAVDVHRRTGEAGWLLEEVLAGRVPRPVPGQIVDISPEVEARRVAAKGKR